MKVLVTGGAGQIGRYVVEELSQAGHDVVVLDQGVPQQRIKGVQYRIGDHEQLGHVVELCPGTDAIIHLSAIAAPGTWSNTTVFRTNVMGTFNVHEAAVIANVPLVVSTSSQSAYGFAYQYRPFMPHYLPMDENHPDLSQDPYGLSKIIGEEIAHTYHRRCDLRVCSLRPPWVIQPDVYDDNFAQILQEAKSWNGMLYSYVDVRDLATAFRLVLEAPPSVIQDEVFNVAADDALATTPLAELLPRLDPRFVDMAKDLTGSQSMVSAQRLKRTLGWQPKYSWRDFVKL
jgi:nucleoside-diphosphate-sugar epimerase